MWIRRSPDLKCSKATQKKNGKRRKQLHFILNGNRACNNGEHNSDQKIYAYMACMSDNDKCPSGDFGDSSQYTN